MLFLEDKPARLLKAERDNAPCQFSPNGVAIWMFGSGHVKPEFTASQQQQPLLVNQRTCRGKL
jgi:hypothetical protein